MNSRRGRPKCSRWGRARPDSAEVGDLLDISEGNVRVLLHCGRAALRQRLETVTEGRWPGERRDSRVVPGLCRAGHRVAWKAGMSPDLRAVVDRHLAERPGGSAYLDQIRATVAQLGQIDDDV